MAIQLDRESVLAQKLKNLCDPDGKELNPTKSAKLLYQLSLIYRDRGPDKFSIIKCVGLLNAAIARRPSNMNQKQELAKVCRLVLQYADAKNQNVNLMKKAGLVKRSIIGLRKETNNLLDCLNDKLLKAKMEIRIPIEIERIRISEIQNIQQKIAHDYLKIMSNLCEYCENVMGKPPCDFAVAGMGSLARKEITPYSDFEHVILLKDQNNYEANVEYFRWYSVIFHIILLNLQETIIPSLNISSLNNECSQLGNWFYDSYTCRGISFDGMMPHACKFPLGRQEPTCNKPWITELIKPVSVMLKYLTLDENLKNGYHLSDILTKTCFVYGDQLVYEQFDRGIGNYIKKQTQEEIIQEIKHQVEEDLNKFSTRFRLVNLKKRPTDNINIKEIIYRSLSLFISALGRINHSTANSCYDIIVELATSAKISENTKHKLMYALAIACQTRLAVYMRGKCQSDEVDIQMLLETFDISDVLNYFQIAYCLQCEVAKFLKFSTFHFYSKPQLINITFCYAFNLKRSTVSLIEKCFEDDNWEINRFDFDACLEILEDQQKEIFQDSNNFIKVLFEEFQAVVFPFLAVRLYVAKLYDEALEFYVTALDLIERKDLSINVLDARIVLSTADCLVHLQKPKSALKYSLQSLKFYQEKLLRKHIAEAHEIIGRCYLKMVKLDHSLLDFKNALGLYEEISIDKERDNNIARVLSKIGCCYFEMNKYELSFNHFKNSLIVYEKLLSDRMHNKTELHSSRVNFASPVSLADNRLDGSQYCAALELYQSELFDQENIKAADVNVARCLSRIGLCLIKMKQFDDALTYFLKSYAIYLTTSLDVETDENLAIAFKNIGCCLAKQKQYSDCVDCLKQVFAIYKNLQQENGKDAATANKLVGWCLLKMKKYDHAMSYFFQSLTIYEHSSQTKANKLALLHVSYAYSSMQARQYEKALDHFREFHEIYRTVWDKTDNKNNMKIREILNLCFLHRADTSKIINKSLRVSGIRHVILDKQKEVITATVVYVCMSECLRQLNISEDAIDFLNTALDVCLDKSKKHEPDEAVAAILPMIGSCAAESKLYENALRNFNRALAIFQSVFENFLKSKMAVDILRVIAIVYTKMNRFRYALNYFSKAQAICQHESVDNEKLSTVATFLYFVGFCMKNLQQYADSLDCFQKCFRILLTTSLDEERDEDIGDTLQKMGHCLQSSQRFNEALNSFSKALILFQNLPFKIDSRKETVHCLLRSIDECKQKL